MAKAAKEALGVETLQAAADVGYYNGETLKACEADAIVAYVPQAKRTGRLAKRKAASAMKTSSTTPGRTSTAVRRAQLLRPIEGLQARHRRQTRDPLCEPQVGLQCVSACARAASPPRRRRRDVYRWEHEDVIDRHRARMAGCRRADAPPRRPRRASLRHAQMPRRLSPLPAARLRQGARRMEPDGAVRLRDPTTLQRYGSRLLGRREELDPTYSCACTRPPRGEAPRETHARSAHLFRSARAGLAASGRRRHAEAGGRSRHGCGARPAPRARAAPDPRASASGGDCAGRRRRP